MRKLFPVGIHQDIAERRALPRLNVEKIDIDCIAFRDTILPAASFDNCVSHKVFSGEKGRAKFHRTRALTRGKVGAVHLNRPERRHWTERVIEVNRPYQRQSAQSRLWE